MTTVPAVTSGDSPNRVPRLVVRTVELTDTPCDLLDFLDNEHPTTWVRRGEGLAARGTAARLDVGGPGRFADADRWWRRLVRAAAVRNEVGLPGTGLMAFGSFTFADAPDAGSSSLVVPELVLGRRSGRNWLTTITTEPALPRVPALDELIDTTPVAEPIGVEFRHGDMTTDDYVAAVAEAVRRIGDGQLDKVVLARDLLATAAEPFDLRAPLARLAERYPACWSFALDGLIGATPEMLIRLENGLVTSRILAGTIRRSDDDAHDLRLAASLARSSKDLEEHEYAVRSVAEALAPHCSSINLPESPFVLHLPNVMHLATDVAGVVTDDSSALELAGALHPSAAVCGTPTLDALDAIASLERIGRGRYSGPVGWTDADGNGEWGIALRCAQQDPSDSSRMRLYAGCGIVADSIPEAELAETEAKLIPVRDALASD